MLLARRCLPARLCAPSLLAGLALTAGLVAHGAVPVRLMGDAKCPSATDVAAALFALAPALDVSTGDDGAAGALRVRVWDDGARYGAEIGGDARFFADPNRRCDERARTVALIVALAADPPSVIVPDVRPPPRVVLAPPPPPPLRWRFHLEAGAVVDAAPLAGSESLTFGGSLRFVFARGRWSGSVAAGGLAPATFDFPRVRARSTAFPLDASLRLGVRVAKISLAPELGLAVRLVSVAGELGTESKSGLRAEVGMRGAITLSFPVVGVVGIFVSAQAVYIPSPAELQVVFQAPTRTEVIGTLPAFHVGAVLGVSVRLD